MSSSASGIFQDRHICRTRSRYRTRFYGGASAGILDSKKYIISSLLSTGAFRKVPFVDVKVVLFRFAVWLIGANISRKQIIVQM